MLSAIRLNSDSAKRPWWRRFGQLLAALMLVWGLGWWALPVWLKPQLESGLTQQLGRSVTVEAVDFRPWSLALRIDGLRVAAATDAARAPVTPQLVIPHIYIDASWQSLWRLAPVLDAVEVSSPQLNLSYLGDGHFDGDDVLARLAAQPDAPDHAVMRFAVSNLLLTDGSVTLRDEPRGLTHHLTQLQWTLPLLSSLASQREQPVESTLSFALDAHPVELKASGTPLGAHPKLQAQIKFQQLDLTAYQVYWPASLPLTVRTAQLDADLGLDFQPDKPTEWNIHGELAAHAVSLAASGARANGPELLGFERLAVQIQALRPSMRQLQLGRIDWQAPRAQVQRDRSGQLNWLAMFQPLAAPKEAAKAAPSTPWQVHAEQWSIQGGQLVWTDARSAKPARLRLDALEVQAHDLSWPLRQPIPFEASAQVDQAQLQVQGSASDRRADLRIKLANLPLKLAAPYLADYLKPTLDGILQAEAEVQWQAGGSGVAGLRARLPTLSLDKAVLSDADKQALVRLARLELTDALVDANAASVTLGRVRISQPALRITRAVDGRWMVQDWLQTPADAPSASKRAGPVARPWTLALDDLRLSAGSLTWRDALVPGPRPVVFGLDDVTLQLRQLSTASGKPFGLQLDARMRHGNVAAGRLSWRGQAGLSPLAIKGALSAERLPLHALAPYLSDRLNIELRRADASFKGQIRYAQPADGVRLQVKGDARLDDVQAFTLAQPQLALASQELLDLKNLSLNGLDLALQPGQALQLDLRETVLTDFYARVTLHENGRLNLQDVLRPGKTAPAATQPGAASVDAALPPVIRLGPTRMQGGRVDFTDHFIQPNYATQLSDLNGQLGAVASQSADGTPQLAELSLHGRAEGSATLEIVGRINPLVQPLALDVQGRVRDLELSPLSTYAARYAGYGIERGKLSVDVAYQVDPTGQLTARNDIVLNQLKFGDAVEGAKNSLPVKLAVALLADRNGVININLPISGSLKDPEFRLMPIIFRLIGNLIMKAVTAPFSLLSHLFSAGDEVFTAVHFAPASAHLDAKAQAELDKVAQALHERSMLKMTVNASASLLHEREAFQRAQLQHLVQLEKRQRMAATPAPGQPMVVSEQEYPDLLKAVYRRAAFAKPRNWVGLTKDIPLADMQALLLSHIDVTEADMQMLAIQRGVAVRDYLAARQVPMERLFLGAVKTSEHDGAWQPQAELDLSVE